MPELIKSRTPLARKTHTCSCCLSTCIKPGDAYLRDTLTYDGRIYDWISCRECDIIAGDVAGWVSSGDDGIGSDDYYYWAEENQKYPEAVSFLQRYGKN